jgi:hypothetical protein
LNCFTEAKRRGKTGKLQQKRPVPCPFFRVNSLGDEFLQNVLLHFIKILIQFNLLVTEKSNLGG